jgi:hypothetical protein
LTNGCNCKETKHDEFVRTLQNLVGHKVAVARILSPKATSGQQSTFSFSMKINARRIVPRVVVKHKIKPTLAKQNQKHRNEPRLSRYQWGLEQARQWARRPTEREPKPPLTKAEVAEEHKSRVDRVAKTREASEAWKRKLDTVMYSLPRNHALSRGDALSRSSRGAAVKAEMSF